MKLVKSLLLGSAAGLAVVSGASAADLPSRKAAPAEYVRVCSAYGAGFFYIPGTDVCLKVGGHARFEAQYAEPSVTAGGKNSNPMGFRGQGRIELDARNPTEYGTLRAFVRLDVWSRTGNLRSGTAERFGAAIGDVASALGQTGAAPASAGWSARAQTGVWLDKAFVQWGGLVAGRTASFFDFYNSPEMLGLLPHSNLGSTNLIGYIATFGSGFYASVSLEDAIMSRQGLIPTSNATGLATATAASAQGAWGGFWMPDVVANIGVDQSWGKIQVSAMVKQINTNGNAGTQGTISGAGVITAGVAAPVPRATKYGFAVSGGVVINLPMIAPGDYLWLQATYADGNAQRIVGTPFGGGTPAIVALKNSHNYFAADGYVDNVTGAVATSKAWGVSAALQHFWTPTLRSAFFGGYASFNNPRAIADFNYWVAGANLFWSPVRALDIGVEGAYQYVQGRNVAGTSVNAVNLKNNDGAFTVRMRIQRSF